MKIILLIIFLLAGSESIAKNINGRYVDDRTLDERCFGFSKGVLKILENRYQGETKLEQLELLEEIDDLKFRAIMIAITKEIYRQQLKSTPEGVALHLLSTEYSMYRVCVKKNGDI